MNDVGSALGAILGIIFLILLILLLHWLRICVVIVKQGTKKVVERFGVYRKTLSEGFHFIIKPFDRIALNPWSVLPPEAEELIKEWGKLNYPEDDDYDELIESGEDSSDKDKIFDDYYKEVKGLPNEDILSTFDNKILEFSERMKNATNDSEKSYWDERISEQRDLREDYLEEREKFYSERPKEKYSRCVKKYDNRDPNWRRDYTYPAMGMDRREVRWTVSCSDANKKRRIKGARPTNRFRLTPAGYTRSLDTHEVLDYIDMRECFINMGENPVITLDNASIGVNTCFFYQVTDVFLYYYGVDKPLDAIKKLTVTTLRNLIGSMTLEQTLISRKEVNTQLRAALDEATNGWGIKINRVEIEEITLPVEIKKAMDDVLIADRKKRAKVIDAEADYIYYVKLKEAEALGYKMIKDAALDENVLRIKGYEAIKHLAEGKSTKIFVPSSINDVVTGSHIFADALKEVVDEAKPKEGDATVSLENEDTKPQENN